MNIQTMRDFHISKIWQYLAVFMILLMIAGAIQYYIQDGSTKIDSEYKHGSRMVMARTTQSIITTLLHSISNTYSTIRV